MAQEWILSNMSESYDRYESEVTVGFIERTVKKRRYQFSCERYAKYAPPLSLGFLNIGYVGSPSEVDVNACAQSVSLLDLMTIGEEGSDGYPEVEKMAHSLNYTTGESGVLMLTENWEAVNIEEEFFNEREKQWQKMSEFPEDISTIFPEEEEAE